MDRHGYDESQLKRIWARYSLYSPNSASHRRALISWRSSSRVACGSLRVRTATPRRRTHDATCSPCHNHQCNPSCNRWLAIGPEADVRPIRWDNQQYTPYERRAAIRSWNRHRKSHRMPRAYWECTRSEVNSPNGGSADGWQVHCLPLVLPEQDGTGRAGRRSTSASRSLDGVIAVRVTLVNPLGSSCCASCVPHPAARELFQGRILPTTVKFSAQMRHLGQPSAAAPGTRKRGDVICDQCRPP